MQQSVCVLHTAPAILCVLHGCRPTGFDEASNLGQPVVTEQQGSNSHSAGSSGRHDLPASLPHTHSPKGGVGSADADGAALGDGMESESDSEDSLPPLHENSNRPVIYYELSESDDDGS